MRVVKLDLVNLINKKAKPLKLKLVLVCSIEKPRLQKEDQFIVKEGYCHPLLRLLQYPQRFLKCMISYRRESLSVLEILRERRVVGFFRK